MEFPNKPSRRQQRNQEKVAGVIKGMQDIILERTPIAQQYFQGVLPGIEVELVPEELT